jgi:regulator of nonsense transcripts 3
MLPPKITTQEFIDSVSPLPEYDYVQVDNPDPEWGAANSVAHINFINSDDAFWFLERFSGYQFIDEQGHSHIALGDFAMSQKIFRPPPNNKNTSTNLERGKLLESEEYIEFLQKYEENPFAFKVGLPLREMKTTEQMVTEIDSRPKRKGTI